MRDLRKKDKLVEAAGDAFGKTLTLLPLDVCSDESVKSCINNVKDRHIDILSKYILQKGPAFTSPHKMNCTKLCYCCIIAWKVLGTF